MTRPLTDYLLVSLLLLKVEIVEVAIPAWLVWITVSGWLE